MHVYSRPYNSQLSLYYSRMAQECVSPVGNSLLVQLCSCQYLSHGAATVEKYESTHVIRKVIANLRRRLSINNCHFCLGSVQHLLEFCDTVSHARVHIRFGALDVVVKIVTEVLDETDRSVGCFGVGKVTGKEDERDVADIVRLCETREVPEL